MARFSINGRAIEVSNEDELLLLDVARDLAVHDVRYGCGAEQCGSCRVLIDGVPAPACTTRVSDLDGCQVTTAEGLADRRVVEALVALNAGQCGFCLAGIAVTATAFLASHPAPTRADIQAALHPHLCRCGAHNRIIDAVLTAASSTGTAHG